MINLQSGNSRASTQQHGDRHYSGKCDLVQVPRLNPLLPRECHCKLTNSTFCQASLRSLCLGRGRKGPELLSCHLIAVSKVKQPPRTLGCCSGPFYLQETHRQISAGKGPISRQDQFVLGLSLVLASLMSEYVLICICLLVYRLCYY